MTLLVLRMGGTDYAQPPPVGYWDGYLPPCFPCSFLCSSFFSRFERYSICVSLNAKRPAMRDWGGFIPVLRLAGRSISCVLGGIVWIPNSRRDSHGIVNPVKRNRAQGYNLCFSWNRNPPTPPEFTSMERVPVSVPRPRATRSLRASVDAASSEAGKERSRMRCLVSCAGRDAPSLGGGDGRWSARDDMGLVGETRACLRLPCILRVRFHVIEFRNSECYWRKPDRDTSGFPLVIFVSRPPDEMLACNH